MTEIVIICFIALYTGAYFGLVRDAWKKTYGKEDHDDILHE